MGENPYRDYPEQYKYADRDFQNHDRVGFVGPPDEEWQPGLMPPPEKHKLYGKHGRICIGISEDIRCYPDDPDDRMYWVRFDEDRIDGPRQVSAEWLVKLREL